MKMMRDYCNLHLKFDVLLLAYVFEEFRNNSIKKYQLDPSDDFSAPGCNV